MLLQCPNLSPFTPLHPEPPTPSHHPHMLSMSMGHVLVGIPYVVLWVIIFIVLTPSLSYELL